MWNKFNVFGFFFSSLQSRSNKLFIYQGFLSQTLTIHRTTGNSKGTIFYSTLSLPSAHEHWDIYLQLCMWDDYHIFLIATLVFTRLLLNEIYDLIKLPFHWLIDWLINDAIFACLILRFCYSNLTWETGGFEFASTITLVQPSEFGRKTDSKKMPSYMKILTAKHKLRRQKHAVRPQNLIGLLAKLARVSLLRSKKDVWEGNMLFIPSFLKIKCMT